MTGIFCTAVFERTRIFPRKIPSRFKEISIPGKKAPQSYIIPMSPPVVGNLNVLNDLSGGNILGRWNHTFSSRSDTTFQFYFDNYQRTGPESREYAEYNRFRFQSPFCLGIAPGCGLGGWIPPHLGQQRMAQSIRRSLRQAQALELFTFFAQDTITLRPDRLFLTAGTKMENSYFSDLISSPVCGWHGHLPTG